MTTFFPDKFHLNSDVEPIRYAGDQKYTFEIPAGQWVGAYPTISTTTITIQDEPSDFLIPFFRNIGNDDCANITLNTTGQWLSCPDATSPIVRVKCRKIGTKRYEFTSECSIVTKSGSVPSTAVWTISQKQTIEVCFNFLTSPFMLQ